jgi:hypothetical protein
MKCPLARTLLLRDGETFYSLFLSVKTILQMAEGLDKKQTAFGRSAQ